MFGATSQPLMQWQKSWPIFSSRTSRATKEARAQKSKQLDRLRPVSPKILAALRQQGLALNALAVTVVALGALTAPALGWLLGIDPAAVLGVLSGATTNTPSLGAVQQTLTTLPRGTREAHYALA